MNYAEIQKYFKSDIPSKEKNVMKSGLEEVKNVIDKMQINFEPKKIVVVSGTNGKGTTSMTLAHLLSAYGNAVGLFTSPHLVKINERIKIGYNTFFSDISEQDFSDAFNYVQNISTRLSYFEYLTCMACYYFFIRNQVDYAIFEVGLGGTYDATNAIPHDTCIITKLGIDHEEYLGSTLKDIAINKFGIINNSSESKQNVIHAPFLSDKVIALSKNYNCNFIEACSFKLDCIKSSIPKFFMTTKYGKAELALPGKRACENTSLALTALDVLGYDPKVHIDTIQSVNWPGRMERMQIDCRDIMLSGDHNSQGIDSLLELLQYYEYDDIYFIVGIAYDKDFNAILQKLCDVGGSHLFLTETPIKTRKVMDYGQWAKICEEADPDWKMLLQKIPKNKKSMIVITGSLYLVGAVKQACCQNKHFDDI